MLPSRGGPAPTSLEVKRRPDRCDLTSDQQKAPLRILLVDDHTDTVITLGALLRNLGYEVACAETVKQALQLAKESKFDLLVSDIGLPDGSGHDLMRQIRAQQSIAGIALSGFGMEDDLEKSRAVGFTEHLIKAGERRSIASDAARDRAEQR